MTDQTPAPAPSQAQATPEKLTTYRVRIRQQDGNTYTRLVEARRGTQVRDYLLRDGTVTIDEATTRECVDLGAAGVKVETAAAGEGGAA